MYQRDRPDQRANTEACRPQNLIVKAKLARLREYPLSATIYVQYVPVDMSCICQNGLQITYLSVKWLNIQDDLVKSRRMLHLQNGREVSPSEFCVRVCEYFVRRDECDIVGTYCAS